MSEKKRKGYKTMEQQIAADKRYLENNFQAKQRRKIIVAKSSCKRFINELANIKELEELETIIEKRKKILKMNNVISILHDIEYGRMGNFDENDKYKVDISLEEITEDEKEEIENLIVKNSDDNSFKNIEDEYGRKYLCINITNEMLLKLIDFFEK